MITTRATHVDVVLVVSRSEHLALIDVISPDRLDDLRLHKMSNAHLRHDLNIQQIQ